LTGTGGILHKKPLRFAVIQLPGIFRGIIPGHHSSRSFIGNCSAERLEKQLIKNQFAN